VNERLIRRLLQGAWLLGLTGAATAWAAPTDAYWHDETARPLAATAPQPGAYRALTLDGAAMAAYLGNAHARGIATSVSLPQPEGGLAEFLVTDSGTLPPELQRKYPDIISLKGSDARGRALRLDVSPLGFQAMVFDPAGVWLVRPEVLGQGDRYLSFRRAELAVPGATPQCEVHGSNIDAAGLALVPPAPMTQTGVKKRVYRAAVAANNKYIAAVGGGTAAGGLAATVAALNRVTQVYESEMAIQLTLVPNNDLIMYPDAASDPFAGNGTGVINNSTTVINAAIGSANYDIGHVFTTGSGGVAGLGVVCGSVKARGTTGLPNPTGEPFYIDYVAHEMGHQFGGNHPFNGSISNCSGGNRNGSTAYEPGSGSTVMGYAGICGADDLQAHSDPFFHAISLQEITNYTNAGGNCSASTPNDNQAPVIDTANLPTGLTIPARTPFVLGGTASDADAGDVLSYSWEEWDLGPQAPLTAGDNGSSPIFRAFAPVPTGTRVFPALSTVLGGAPLKGETLPTTTRALKFRLTVRDNRAGAGTSQSADIALSVANSAGPFKVTAPAGAASWGQGSLQTVTWDVANTNVAPVSCGAVDITLSADGGQTFPHTLASGVANSGSASVTVPAITTSQARVSVSCATNVFFNVSPGDFTIAAAGELYTVGGTVAGLAGSGLVLRLNGGSDLTVGTNGPFTFAGGLVSGTPYTVTVGTQPAGQTCTVANGSGTIGTANVDNVAVTCTTATTYTVGGTVAGLSGSGLTLKLNGGNDLAVNANGPFTFAGGLASGSAYTVTIGAQPTGQACTIANGGGTIGSANITNVTVTCADLPPQTYTVGGRVSGLAGSGLVLQLNGGATLPMSANGLFVFTGGLPGGAAYAVTVTAQPANPAQTCTVANGSGTVAGANVTNVAVTCTNDITDRIFADGFETSGGQTCAPLQLFQDPGFEATVDYDNPFWASTDSLGGTSFCDEACDDGGQFVARSGQWFVWFGGWDQPNTATLSQSVVIPAGQPRWLNYWMVNQIGGDGTAFLKLSIDGAPLATIAPQSGGSDWAQAGIQMPAKYLDGQPHLIAFSWTADAPGGAIGGAMIDDMTLDCQAAAGQAPARSGRPVVARKR
jgi:hypothetical protein